MTIDGYFISHTSSVNFVAGFSSRRSLSPPRGNSKFPGGACGYLVCCAAVKAESRSLAPQSLEQFYYILVLGYLGIVPGSSTRIINNRKVATSLYEIFN